MFPSSSADVAVSHFSNWSVANWILGYALLGIAVLLAGFAVSLWTSAKYTAPVGVYGWSVAAGVLAVVVEAVTLWQVARHIEQFRWVIALAVLVVAAVALVTHRPPARPWSMYTASRTTPRALRCRWWRFRRVSLVWSRSASSSETAPLALRPRFRRLSAGSSGSWSSAWWRSLSMRTRRIEDYPPIWSNLAVRGVLSV